MRLIFKLFVALWLFSPVYLVAGDLFAPEPVVVEDGYRMWQLSVNYDFENGNKIIYTYSEHGVVLAKDTLITGMYSDLSPAAVVAADGTVILVWSSVLTLEGDSDIYYAIWQGSGWSEAKRVHPDNSLPDMNPELLLNDAGEVQVSWWRNTTRDVVRMEALFSDGKWTIITKVDGVDSDIGLLQSEDDDFYGGMRPREEQEPLRCIAAGDSITAGCRRDEYGNTNSWCSFDRPRTGETTGGYVGSLNSYLGELVPGSVVYNYGWPGARSYHGVDKINYYMSLHPDSNCVLIMYGANDLYQGLHPSSTRANVELIAQRARAAGRVPVIATVTPNTARSGIEPYRDALLALSAEEKITIANQYNAVQPWSIYHSGDGLHLNDAGDIRVSTEWKNVILTNRVLFPPEPEPITVPGVNLLLLR